MENIDDIFVLLKGENMKIIISPAKKMNINNDFFDTTTPLFLDKANLLCKHIKSLSYEDVKKMWKCNDEIAKLNVERFSNMDLKNASTPAVFSYEGLQYKHIAAHVFSEAAFAYIREHLRILSGLYGVLKPFDAVFPYRLEMQSKLKINQYKDLYEFWGNLIYQNIMDEDRIVINLASKEYSRMIEKYLKPGDIFITIEFGEWVDGKVKQKGTFSKMARGEMVRFLSENQIKDIKDIKKFKELRLNFSEELSTDSILVFLK